MEKKKIILYLLVILTIMVISAFSAPGIRSVTDVIVEKLTDDKAEISETETETGEGAVSNQVMKLEPETEIQPEDSAEDHADQDTEVQSSKPEGDTVEPQELYASKESFDERMQAYISRQNPIVTESRNGLKKMLVGEQEERFSRSLAEHLFSLYEESFLLTRIEVLELTSQTAEEVTGRIYIYAEHEGEEYSETLLCTYYPEWNFFGFESYL